MVEEKLRFDICQIAIGCSDLIWKFIQTVGEKLWFDTLSNRNWVFRLGLEIHPNSREKIVIWHFVKSQFNGQTRFGTSSKRSKKNCDLTFCRIAIGCSDLVWRLIQMVGEKLWFDTLPNRNLVVRLDLEIHPNGRGKIVIWHFVES